MRGVRINSSFFYRLGVITLLFYNIYVVILESFLGTSLATYLFFGLSILFVVTGKCLEKKLSVSKKNLWLYSSYIYILVVVLVYDVSIQKGEYFAPGRIILCIIIMILLSDSWKWIGALPKTMATLGIPNALATIFFWISPSSYDSFSRIFLNGTTLGVKKPYTYGLTDFYSENGIYIAFTILALWSHCLKNKKDKFAKICLLINIFALILTSKRAHMIFVVFTTVVVYFIENPRKLTGNIIKGMVGVCVGIGINLWASKYVPAIQETIERLMLIGTADDNTSKTRFVFWAYAIEWFKEKPIFGNGFFYFKYRNLALDKYGRIINAHNVYIQLLCETGIVGTTIYIIGYIAIFIRTLKTYWDSRDSAFSKSMILSLAIQIFVFAYQMTGNGLYDRTFPLYILGAAVVGAVMKTNSAGAMINRT